MAWICFVFTLATQKVIRMKKVEKYLMLTVFQNISLIVLCLLVLQIFILLVNQMNDLGKGYYHFAQAIQFVFYRLPYELSVSFPVISLLGVLLGLSHLATHGELGILRVNGISILNIIWIVARVGIGIIVIVMFLTELFVPQMMRKGNTLKLEAMNQGQLLRQAQSLWFRHQENFWYFAEVRAAEDLRQVTMFNKDHQGNIRQIAYYPQISWQNGRWNATEVQKTYFKQQEIAQEKQEKPSIIELPLNPEFFKHLEQNPDEMSLKTLWHRVYQLKNQQNIAKEELILWQRLLQPWNALMMMLLAIPCIFGPLRTSTMGAKLLTGIALGFSFYIFNQMFGFISQVYQLAPILGASMPLMMFTSIGAMLFYRQV